MPVDRKLHRKAITKAGAPPWICPTCAAAMLRLDNDSLKFSMTGESFQSSDQDWFDAQHVVYRFTALLRCANESCKEAVVVAGRGELEEHPDDRMESLVYEETFFPQYFNPSPALISIPSRCPDAVQVQLHSAFIASWSDFASSANRIRVAAEQLLDAMRIPKTITTSNGTRRSISLHKRIESMPVRYTTVRDSLLAIKWLGNSGSHEAELSQDAVYDALDIFETVLTEIYSEHPRRIKRLVATVNKRRGPLPVRK